MAQYEHTQLVYTARVAGKNYIDLTRGLALMNGKNCSQFSSKDKPLLVHASVRMGQTEPTQAVVAAKNTWIVRNACVKAAAAWRRTLRSAGIRRKKQLNTYARNPRFALDFRHSATFGQLSTASASADIIPSGVDASYATGQYNSDGDEIQVLAYNSDPSALTPFGTRYVRAFTQTTFAVPQSGSTDVLDKKANLLGDIDPADPQTYTSVVAEYIDSRINDADIEDTDLDESPSNDNDFVMMLAPGEEVADDVLDNVDDEGKWRPYSLNTSTSSCTVISAGAQVAGQDTMIEAPLGLLEWTAASTNDTMIVDVVAITEM